MGLEAMHIAQSWLRIPYNANLVHETKTQLTFVGGGDSGAMVF